MSIHGADAAPKFSLGRVIATEGATERLTRVEMLFALHRHGEGDWGDLGPSDISENDRALKDGGRIVSIYESRSGVRFYVVTEPDRSVTTILLPSEY